MKVLFLKHIINVWKEGEVKDVKPGYAANMLFPQWLAVEFTPQVEKQFKEKMKKKDAHRREMIENKHQFVEKLNGQTLTFTLRGSKGKVYGGIGEKDIIEQIKKKYKIELTKKHVELPEGHIKKEWESQIFVDLGKDAMAKMTVVVTISND